MSQDRTLLIRHADVVVTMDTTRRELRDAGLFARNGVIEQVDVSAALPREADEVLDLRGQVLLPGLVNTHHHMYQSLTRVVPAAQDCELFAWLKTLYPIWARLRPDMIRVSSLTAMAELMLSGCTTSSDHLYIYPNGCRLDDSIEAAQQIGLRFHATRGAMSVGESQGGLPPDQVVEDEATILRDTQRLIERYHDSARHAMTRVAVAPCSPFSVSRALMTESAKLARSHGVGLHTHLAENVHDVAYSREHFGCTPAQYAEDLGWVGADVWHAHCVQLDAAGINRFAQTGTAVAHCPCSNMRLASGIAPVRQMRNAGVTVGLGVDGSASNDGAHLLGEARQALLLARVGGDPGALSARMALELATLGGAKTLGRDDIGALAPGMAADCVSFNLNEVGYAGAQHDPVAALLFCAPTRVCMNVIAGRVVVRHGELATLELAPVLEQHRRMARELVNGER